MLATPEFWVAVSFVAFILLLVYLGVPGLIISHLDQRSERIKAELDEARRLREEAQALLADYQRKRRDAEKEAELIVAAARDEASRQSKEAHAALKDSLERRVKNARNRIAQAERQALVSVRSKAVDVAVAAARQLLSREITAQTQGELLSQNLRDVEKRLA